MHGVKVTYSADSAAVDRRLTEIIGTREERGSEFALSEIKVRWQPTVRALNGQYQAWNGVSWMVTCATTNEALGLRDAMAAFFEAVVRADSERVQTVLKAIG